MYTAPNCIPFWVPIPPSFQTLTIYVRLAIFAFRLLRKCAFHALSDQDATHCIQVRANSSKHADMQFSHKNQWNPNKPFRTIQLPQISSKHAHLLFYFQVERTMWLRMKIVTFQYLLEASVWHCTACGNCNNHCTEMWKLYYVVSKLLESFSFGCASFLRLHLHEFCWFRSDSQIFIPNMAAVTWLKQSSGTFLWHLWNVPVSRQTQPDVFLARGWKRVLVAHFGTATQVRTSKRQGQREVRHTGERSNISVTCLLFKLKRESGKEVCVWKWWADSEVWFLERRPVLDTRRPNVNVKGCWEGELWMSRQGNVLRMPLTLNLRDFRLDFRTWPSFAVKTSMGCPCNLANLFCSLGFQRLVHFCKSQLS